MSTVAAGQTLSSQIPSRENLPRTWVCLLQKEGWMLMSLCQSSKEPVSTSVTHTHAHTCTRAPLTGAGCRVRKQNASLSLTSTGDTTVTASELLNVREMRGAACPTSRRPQDLREPGTIADKRTRRRGRGHVELTQLGARDAALTATAVRSQSRRRPRVPSARLGPGRWPVTASRPPPRGPGPRGTSPWRQP